MKVKVKNRSLQNAALRPLWERKMNARKPLKKISRGPLEGPHEANIRHEFQKSVKLSELKAALIITRLALPFRVVSATALPICGVAFLRAAHDLLWSASSCFARELHIASAHHLVVPTLSGAASSVAGGVWLRLLAPQTSITFALETLDW